MSNNIDKNKMVLVHSKDDYIKDIPLETKEIGYYKDSFIRFKKNKASFVAFIIICFLMFFILVGPYMKNYTLYRDDRVEAGRLANLTPRIPLLENIGIFDGTNTITVGKRFLTFMYHSEFGNGIILSGMPEELTDNPLFEDKSAMEIALMINNAALFPETYNITSITVKVDWYSYTNFKMSYMPEDYFSILDRNNSDNNPNNDVDPLLAVTRTYTEAQFIELLRRGVVIDILSITQSGTTVQYSIRVNQFLLALDQLPEDTYFWFGTTGLGADLFTELWSGARISLMIAFLVVLINSIVGLTVGAIAGYYGGLFDLIFDRFVDIVYSLPFLVILTLLVLRFGSPIWVVILAFTATGWIGAYATGRSQFYRFKNREYVLAARTLGASDARIMFKHIFPNTLGLIVTSYALAIPGFVFTEATFSFLGIIEYDNATSVGQLIERGQNAMSTFPHLLLFPATYIAILMITFNLFGNGLRDAFNPSLRGVE